MRLAVVSAAFAALVVIAPLTLFIGRSAPGITAEMLFGNNVGFLSLEQMASPGKWLKKNCPDSTNERRTGHLGERCTHGRMLNAVIPAASDPSCGGFRPGNWGVNCRWITGKYGEMWLQKIVDLKERSRGFHLVTREVEQAIPELERVKIGMAHIFIQHTSASLTINENADPDVRADMETYFNRIVPEQGLPLLHTLEGPDDMPAHVKASMLGPSLSVPISNGGFAFGTWQGIYLCEHRNRGGSRRLVVTIQGE